MLVKGSFEDFIYIIVGIIWIAYSIYRGAQKNKKKSKPVEHGQPEEEKSKTAFESFLDEIMEVEKPPPYVAEEKSASFNEPEVLEEKSERQPFSYDDSYEESNFGKDLGVYDSKAEKSLKLEKKQTAKPTKKTRKPHIDLRKAVVYSEILNRRYF